MVLLGTGLVVLANAAPQWRAVSQPCVTGDCRQPQLSARGAAALASSGLSLTAWATGTVVVALLLAASLMAMSRLVVDRSRGRLRTVVPLVLLLAAAGLGSSFLPWTWASAALNGAALLGIFWFLATYPSGTFEPAWAAVPFVAVVGWALTTLAPGIGRAVSEGRQPWVIIYGLGFAVCVGAAVVAQVVRYRRADRETRRALGAVSASLAVLVVVGASWTIWSGTHPVTHGVGTLMSAVAAETANVLLVLVLAAAVTGVVSRDTYVLRVAVDRVLATAVVLTVAGLVYAGTSLALSAASDGWPAHAVSGVVTAVVVGGLFRRIVTGVDRLIFGEIGDPHRLTADIAAMVAGTRDASLLLPEVLDLAARRFYLPDLRLTDDPNAADASHAAVPLRSGEGARPLALLVRLPPGRRRLSARERRALRAIGPAILSSVTAVELTGQLRRSRLRLAAAVAEERRSIRRELHDELGQLLASARNRVAAARAGLSDDPATLGAGTVDGHLERADVALADSVEWVRMLARALRPPVLDEQGLAAAVRAAATDLGLDVTVTEEAPDLAAVPGEVETAVYRIVVEALVNVSRHAATTQAAVRLGIEAGELVVVVTDDGIGMGTPARSGVGLASMRERVDELGGSVCVTSSARVGTRVEIRLPVRAGAPDTDDLRGPVLAGLDDAP